jgi:hypothetical protein
VLIVNTGALAMPAARTSAQATAGKISPRAVPKLGVVHKWPLYTYVSDSAAGQARGQALNLNGGYWYVLAPSGKVIRTH